MLYDPKWEVKSDPFTLKSFADWLGQQPREMEYEYWCTRCAVGSYLMAQGFKVSKVGFRTWTDENLKLHDFPEKWNEISRETPRTYGAAADRARAFVTDKRMGGRYGMDV